MREDCRGRVGSMQGREHEMPGLGRRERDSCGLRVPHLAHDDHVRCLSQGSS